MRTLLLTAVLVLVAPATSRAEFGLGLRIGYGEPRGDYLGSVDYSTLFQVDAMFKTSPRTATGVYVGYAVETPFPGTTASCDAASTKCSASTSRAGLQFTWEFLDLGLVGLWGGIGSGYVATTSKEDGPRGTIETQVRGWEWATISAGADLKPLKLISAGLYVGWGIGQFNVFEQTGNILGVPVDEAYGIYSEKRLFHVYQIGLRGLFNL